MEKKPCCGARRDTVLTGDALLLSRATAVPRAEDAVMQELRAALLPVPGGIFEMGARRSTFADDGDSPRRKVKLAPFRMAPATVTNDEYARFVAATGYRTVAEQEGWAFVFHLLLPDAEAWPESPPGARWWRKVDGACWSAPEGPGSDLAGRGDHPVVQIAWYDALAYCTWSGLSLPTEAQWERAARGGLAKRKFPWGDEMMPGGAFAMNTFQGTFPHHNTAEDGWIGTAPARSFQPNGYGMYNMTGNVWEWVADRFAPHPAPGRLPDVDPVGPEAGQARVQRGGSYLCHVSYCDRYHVHSRTRNDPDSSVGNAGFRVCAPA
ncbi:formylglycine-generating enzyme family protein [Falsirhodobacter algicola]|uniref:SUMF1/EgtB/PvdO family nonheme iron enzyme n=1 Tax=Falsirhodobacter algicola TaxID=2692330 RepID=A0A8J8SK61_9RHOB|nr:formylglycine-generating enzyme family protein [Falsirhodobacter algicola]QUS35022.1 SUMF1/EgtB/PvdO family nonheme iron enzyme [Falsirhodobacter algicola]